MSQENATAPVPSFPSPLRGLANLRFHAADLAAARAFYVALLGVAPYFERPGYLEFRIGDRGDELGIVESAHLGRLGDHRVDPAAPSGAVAYWHVEDLPATRERLLGLGAVSLEPIRDFGGFVVASVVDPFGNVVGLMTSPHYRAVRDGARA